MLQTAQSASGVYEMMANEKIWMEIQNCKNWIALLWMLGGQSKIRRTNSLIIKLCICIFICQLNFIKWASDLTTRVGNVHQLLVLFFLYCGLLGFLGTNNPMHWWVAPWASTRTSSAVPIKRLDCFTQRMSKWQYGLASVGFITATGWADQTRICRMAEVEDRLWLVLVTGGKE